MLQPLILAIREVLLEKYKEQLKRAHRYYVRLKALNEGLGYSAPADTYFDDMYAFFQNCYHIKDWLKNDKEFILYNDKQIENYVSNSLSLSICADICNGVKHLTLNSKTRSKAEPKLVGREISLHFNDSLGSPSEDQSATFKVNFLFEHDGKIIDAFELATDAMAAWESFIQCDIRK
jgi:hypothetical protein